MRPATCSGRRRRRQRPRTRSNKQPVAPIIEGGYNLGMLSVSLTIIVRLDQAASLDRLEDFREERRTATVLPPRNSLVTSGHWQFRSKPLRQSETPTTWLLATGTR